MFSFNFVATKLVIQDIHAITYTQSWDIISNYQSKIITGSFKSSEPTTIYFSCLILFKALQHLWPFAPGNSFSSQYTLAASGLIYSRFFRQHCPSPEQCACSESFLLGTENGRDNWIYWTRVLCVGIQYFANQSTPLFIFILFASYFSKKMHLHPIHFGPQPLQYNFDYIQLLHSNQLAHKFKIITVGVWRRFCAWEMLSKFETVVLIIRNKMES